MIQKRDDKKPDHEPFKMRSLMLDLDEYLRIFIIPQIPAGFSDYREVMRTTMGRAWRAMYHAAMTVRRERQHHLMDLKIELAMVETYLKEIRDVCYRGKEKRKLDATSARRFEICAEKQKAVMSYVWAWVKNEDKKMPVAGSQKTAGLVEKELI
ncbi:hypothetical protein IKG64_03010 [Candidatus Saccharibacteria bacterium]|nr:hypothetical protein [Candidatus Saccharibacteria bacterium]